MKFTDQIKLFFIRIIIPAFIGLMIGYLIYENQKKTKEENKTIKGTICLVIDDYGYIFNKMTKSFFTLDSNITIAIIPGAPFSRTIGRYVDSLNMESIIHMPMESYEKDKTTYKIELNEKLNSTLIEQRVDAAFIEIPSAIGMSNHEGSKATISLQLMKDLARVLRKKNKYFLDSFTNSKSRAFITMRQYGVPTQVRQVFLDHVEDPTLIEANLDSLAMLSHHMAVAVGIAHVKPTTLDVLQKAIPRLQKEGYQFIRLSDAVQ